MTLAAPPRFGILRDDRTFASEFRPDDASDELVKRVARAGAERKPPLGGPPLSIRARRALTEKGEPSDEAKRRADEMGEHAIRRSNQEMATIRETDESLFWLLRAAQALRTFYDLDDPFPRSPAVSTADETKELRNGSLLVGFMALLEHQHAKERAHGRSKGAKPVLAQERRLQQIAQQELKRTGSQTAAARRVAKERMVGEGKNPDKKTVERTRGRLRRSNVFGPPSSD